METTLWSTEEIGVVKSSMGAEIINKKVRPLKDGAINCPRCNSTNTKFCYYNNYSLTQPRYFCKTCRRYWTEGGTLRNVPVGGGSRKNKRLSSSSPKLPDLNPNPNNLVPENHQNPNNIAIGSGQDLSLGFRTMSHDHHTSFHGVIPQFLELPKMDGSNHGNNHLGSTPISAMDLLRSGMASRGFTSFISSPGTPNLNALYTSGFPFQESKPIADSTDHAAVSLNNYSSGGPGDIENGGATIMFPVGGLKQLSSINEAHHHQTKGQENNSTSGLYWNGMLSGTTGGSW